MMMLHRNFNIFYTFMLLQHQKCTLLAFSKARFPSTAHSLTLVLRLLRGKTSSNALSSAPICSLVVVRHLATASFGFKQSQILCESSNLMCTRKSVSKNLWLATHSPRRSLRSLRKYASSELLRSTQCVWVNFEKKITHSQDSLVANRSLVDGNLHLDINKQLPS